jgi:hypothetical protein
LALSGWLSFRNFGMPDILGWVALCRSKHTHLLQLDLLSLTAKGLAPKFSKRTILTGLIHSWLDFDYYTASEWLRATGSRKFSTEQAILRRIVGFWCELSKNLI